MTPDEFRAMDCRVHEAMTGASVSPLSTVVPYYATDPALIDTMIRWIDARVDYPVCLYFAIDEYSVGEGPGEAQLENVLSDCEPTPNLALCAAVLAVGKKEPKP